MRDGLVGDSGTISIPSDAFQRLTIDPAPAPSKESSAIIDLFLLRGGKGPREIRPYGAYMKRPGSSGLNVKVRRASPRILRKRSSSGPEVARYRRTKSSTRPGATNGHPSCARKAIDPSAMFVANNPRSVSPLHRLAGLEA